MEIARGFDGEIEEAVPGEEVEHVVEEPDAGVVRAVPGAVEVERQLDLRFLGVARDRGGAVRRMGGSLGHIV